MAEAAQTETNQAERACKILAAAAADPHTEFRTWCFLDEAGRWLSPSAPPAQRSMVRLTWRKGSGFTALRFTIEDALAHRDRMPAEVQAALA